MRHIQIIEGDITHAQVDVIVNAANPIMLGGGGVDGAIHRAAGPDLLMACRQVKSFKGIRCPTGEARITAAGNLMAKYVIHAVGPIYRQNPHPEQTLRSVYQHSLNLAQNHNCQSIAFPAISCGVYGYPLEEAANIALSVCNQLDYHGLRIVFYLWGKKTYAVWQTALAGL